MQNGDGVTAAERAGEVEGIAGEGGATESGVAVGEGGEEGEGSGKGGVDSSEDGVDGAAGAPNDSYPVVRLKYRALANKAYQRMEPAGGQWGMFGLSSLPTTGPPPEELIITEGEFDAMAVFQETGRPAVSLPNGCRSLPLPLLPFLDQFPRIILWLDNDAPGQESAAMFARKLGQKRCLLVRPLPEHAPPSHARGQPMPKDANDAMLAGWDVNRILASAARIPNEDIASFGDLRSAVRTELFSSDTARRGVQSTTLPLLNDILKGHRRGEVTVLTGSTGTGKTTFLSQLSLDYAGGGVNTLWGSFEIKNTRLAITMLGQYFSTDMQTITEEQYEIAADEFEMLPLQVRCNAI